MLSLDLGRIRAPTEHFEQVYGPAAGLASESDLYAVVAPVSLTFEIRKDQGRKGQFQLVGRVKATLELPCSRCLEPFTLPVDAPFDLRYQPQPEPTGEAEQEVSEDDLSTAFYENEAIDLGQMMREQFYLALPMKPLCVETCQGLCPDCGTNLNRSRCSCTREWSDPRLAILKGLKTTQHNGH